MATSSNNTIPVVKDIWLTLEIKDGAGGVWAKQRISRGTRVLLDSIVIYVPKDDDATHISKDRVTKNQQQTYRWSLITTAFNKLPKALQEDILRQPSKKCRFRKAIFKTMELADKPPLSEQDLQVVAFCQPRLLGESCFCPRGWRFRQSCVPNVFACNHQPKVNMFTFHATRDVMPGEELTMSWIDHAQRLVDRETELARHWITCSCVACTPDSARNKHGKTRIEVLNSRMNSEHESKRADAPRKSHQQSTLERAWKHLRLLRTSHCFPLDTLQAHATVVDLLVAEESYPPAVLVTKCAVGHMISLAGRSSPLFAKWQPKMQRLRQYLPPAQPTTLPPAPQVLGKRARDDTTTD